MTAAAVYVPALRDPLAQDTTWLTHTENYLNSGEGEYRILALAKNALALIASSYQSLFDTPLLELEEASEVCGRVAGGLAIVQAPALAIGAGRAVAVALTQDVTRPVILDCFQKVSDAVCATLSAVAQFVTSGPVLQISIELFNVFADAGDAAIAADRLNSLQGADVRDISNEVKKAAQEETILYRIKAAKAITALAAGVLGVFGLLYGAAIVPAVVLLSLSVASSVFAVVKYFYDKSRTYNDALLIKNFDLFPLKAQ